MLHHNAPAYVKTLEADRRAAGRHIPGDAGELERILNGAARCDDAAWESLVERFSRAIRAVARSYRLSPHDTDDIEQTTWLRLLERIHQVREPNAVGGWLRTTAQRESIRTIHGRRRHEPATHDVLERWVGEDETARPDVGLVATDRAAAVHVAVRGLPEREQRLMTLLFAEPAPSYDDISDALDMPKGSIGPTRARCLERLRADGRLNRTIEA